MKEFAPKTADFPWVSLSSDFFDELLYTIVCNQSVFYYSIVCSQRWMLLRLGVRVEVRARIRAEIKARVRFDG